MDQADEVLRHILKEAIGVRMTFTQEDGTTFTVYAKSLKDAEKMTAFMDKLVQGITKKVRTNLEVQI